MSDSKGPSTEVKVAIIGLIGVIGTAIIANWDKLFLPEKPIQKEQKVQIATPSDVAAPLETKRPDHTFQLAESMTRQWFSAYKDADFHTMTELSSPPFAYDSEYLMSKRDILERYRYTFDEQYATIVKIKTIKSGELGDMKAAGMVRSDDRVLKNIKLNDTDIAVVVL